MVDGTFGFFTPNNPIMTSNPSNSDTANGLSGALVPLVPEVPLVLEVPMYLPPDYGSCIRCLRAAKISSSVIVPLLRRK